MPTPPFAKLRVAVNGGAPQTGALNVAAGNSIQLSAESTVGWTSAPRWEFYGYPPGWTAPAGWSTDASGVIYNTAVVPPAFTLPSVGGIWGKWLPRLIVNSSSIDPNTGAGTPLPQLVDSATAFQIASALGLKDLAQYEDKQFGPNWAKDHQANLRTLDAAIGALQAGQGGALTASGTITSGKVVVSVPSQPSKLQQFTIPAMLAGAQIRGIATSSATNGQTVTYGPNGSVVGNAVTGLGASTAGARVGVLTDGSLSALARSFGGFEVGSTDSSGNVSVAPISHVKQAPSQPFTPVAYGAIPNDSSPTAQHANLIALNLMMADINRLPQQTHEVVIHDTFYVEDTWFVTAPVTITGVQGGGPGNSMGTLLFPNDDEGVHLVSFSIAADGNPYGGCAHIQNVAVRSSFHATGTPVPLWQAGHDYVRNDVVRHPRDARFVYRCIVAGHSGGSAPAAFGSPTAITPQRWSPNALYAVGKYIFPPRSSAQYGLSAYVVTSANGSSTPGALGIAGAAAPTFPPSGPVTSGELVFTRVTIDSVSAGLAANLSIVDGVGALRWIPEAITGILCYSVPHIYRCSVSGWKCDAIALHGTGIPPIVTVCDFGLVELCVFGNCAGGLSFRGSDSNACKAKDCVVISVGFDRFGTPYPGIIGNAYVDGSQSGSRFDHCEVEICSGAAYTPSVSGVTVFIDCISDGNNLSNNFVNSCIVVGGADSGATFDNSAHVLGSRNNVGASNQYRNPDVAGITPIYAGPTLYNGRTAYPLSSKDENDGNIVVGWEYAGYFEGWWLQTRISLPQAPLRFIDGISGTRAGLDGSGNKWNFVGQYEGGTTSDRIYVGVSPSFATDGTIRFAQRKSGDYYRANRLAGPGDFTHRMCSLEGIAHTNTWAPSMGFATYDATINAPPDIVAGSGTWTYECSWNNAGVGFSSGSDPFGTPTADIAPRLVRKWTANIKTYPGDKWMATVHPDPAMTVQTYFEVERPALWSAGLTVTTNQVIQPRNVLGSSHDEFKDVFIVDVDPYNPATLYEVGYLVQPSNKSGTTAYACTSVPTPDGPKTFSGAYNVATLTGTEPNWAGAPPFVSGNGYIFAAVTLTTGAGQPTWAGYPQVISALQAKRSILDGNVPWRRIQLDTGPTQPTWDRTVPNFTTSATSEGYRIRYKALGTFNNAAIVDDNGLTWNRVGFEPKFDFLYGKVESADVDITPQPIEDWYDPNQSLSSAANQGRRRTAKRRITTSAITADQVIDDGYGTNHLVQAAGTVVVAVSYVAANQGSGTAGGGWRVETAFRDSAGVPTRIAASVITALGADAALGAPTLQHKVVAGFIALVVTPANVTNTVWTATTTRTEG